MPATGQVQAGSWWLLATTLAILASVSSLPGIAAVILIAITLPLALRRSASSSLSLGFYLKIAAAVVVIRVLFRVIFNYGSLDSWVLLQLPQLSLDLGAAGTVRLFGTLTWSTFQSGLTDGLRLAAIILSVAMANLLADPRALMRALPPVFREVATSISIAINLAPQLITSLQRVRRAQSLRGQTKGLGRSVAIVIPVLEDAIDRSMALAASMESRGFARRGVFSAKQQMTIRALTLAALASFAFATFLLLTGFQTEPFNLSLLLLGVLLLATVLKLSSRGHHQTRYRQSVPNRSDFTIYALSLAVLALSLAVVFG